MMRDYSGMEVRVGDHVIDDRGRLYRVTDDELAAEGIGRGQELRLRHGLLKAAGSPVALRLYHCFRVSEEHEAGDAAHNRRLYAERFAEIAAAERGKVLTRQRDVDADLRQRGLRR